MAGKKIIAVVGATGAQGGGLVRAILNDKRSAFAVRALTRDVNSRQGERAGDAGRRSRGGRRRRRREPEARLRGGLRRLLRHLLLGALLAREGDGGGRGTWRDAAKAAGVKHVDLVHPRGHAQVDPAQRQPHADAAWASTRCRTSTPRARPTTSSPTWACRRRFLLTSFYWDNLIHFGIGPEEGPGRQAGDHPAHGRQEAPGHRGRGHRQVRLRHLQAGARVHRQDGRHRRRAPDRRADGRRPDQGAGAARCVYNDVSHRTSTASFGFPGADDLGNMFQFKRDFEKDFCGARDLTLSPVPQSVAADV